MWKVVLVLLALVLFNANYAQAGDDCVKYTNLLKKSQEDCKKAVNQLNFTSKKLANCASIKNPHKSCEADFEWVKKAYDNYASANHDYMKAREKIDNKCK